MLRKTPIVALILLLIFVIGGCFEYEEELVLKDNLSGTLHVHYVTREGSEIEVDDYSLPTKEDEIRREIEEKYTSDKVKLDKFKVGEKGDWQYVDFTVKFNEVLDLNDLEQLGNSRIEIKEQGNGKFEFVRTLKIDSDWEENEEESVLAKMALSLVENAILDKVKFRFTVTTPKKINKNNADWVRNDNQAVWRFRLTDLVKKSRIDMHLDCR